MGGGSWTRDSFTSYATTKAATLTNATFDSVTMSYSGDISSQEMFTAHKIDPMLNPKGVIRECCDSEEHPNTIPIVIGLDVTGSMSSAGVEVARKINDIITDLYERYTDIQILVMGIGDLAYDSAPIQISQFESDIRIAEQLDLIYFEKGGGGNGYESYSAAWYMGLKHMKLDCWSRGKRGIIITTGDEPLNPYLPQLSLNAVCGDSNEKAVDTKELYDVAKEKFDIFHIAVNDSRTAYKYYETRIDKSFGKILEPGHLKVSNMDMLAKTIVDCIDESLGNLVVADNDSTDITW